MPVWFPWIFVGGICFVLLSILASKYKGTEYKKIQYFQDFISGSILIGFIGIMMPDVFPQFNIPVEFPIMSSDIDLQVGPPRLFGK
jgi:hypothetical protein